MKAESRHKTVSIAIHIIGWGFVFGLPLLFTDHTANGYLQHYLRFSTIPLALLTVFYINYFFLVEKFLFDKKSLSRFWIFNLVMVVCVSFALMAIRHCHAGQHLPPHPEESFLQAAFGFFFRDMIPLILAVGMSVALKVTNRWVAIEKELETLEKERMEAELKTLKSQINPHFLFNTLNNIYSLTAISPDKAQQAILELSKLMRYVLYENTPRYVPLGKEIDFIHNYVELMRLRLTADTEVIVELPTGKERDIEVAPLLFIALIENAFKHGVSNTRPSFVHIKLRATAAHDIECRIENSCFPKDESDKSGSGIGLDNLRKRLDILYAGRYDYTVEQNDTRYCATLTLHPQKQLP